MELGQAFIQRSRSYLVHDYLPKIRRAVGGLSRQDVWWRPNETSNSIGNLILHLAGNTRQWVVSGIGGAQDRRRREEEFRARDDLSVQELLSELEEAAGEADLVLGELSPEELSAERVIQGLHVTVMDAVYHVVEHFSTHTGQIIYIAKLRSGEDLGFWEVKDGKAVPRW